MSRGDRNDAIFREDQDRLLFLDTLSEACGRQGWIVHAYVLMDNHYHLLLETPEPNLVAGMKWLQGTYTQRFNSRRKEWGHLFQGRYKALVVQAGRGDYFSTVATYIHLNPARARLLDFETRELSAYFWSSYPLYLDQTRRPEWLCVDRVLGEFQWLDEPAGLSAFRLMMTKRTLEVYSSGTPMEFDARWKAIRQGWCLGDDDFRQKMGSLIDTRINQYTRRSYLGDEARLHDEREAARLLGEGLEMVGLVAGQLSALRKSDPRKKMVAWLIRRNTGIGNQWICENLAMGHASNLSRLVKEVDESTDASMIRFREMTKKAF